ncbi:glutamate mutase subunit E [Hydrogenispora ethanolica]|uniref:Glutamate mutase epsilon subunit n=1 Tax=Hydrogenispora ethanolica TaxID=1082276 RepID=A0A4R1R9Q1_HYDET|nr:methylaspartate mutase subunit E [Hydrogenispora ethanolica]TCL62453.1 glutamate mutase subunit E [Hydrogenispora ethanolica]
MELTNRRLSEGDFEAIRREALGQWPTGAEVDPEEAVAYQKRISKTKRFSERLARAQAEGEILIQPRAGVALVEEQIALLKYLETEGEADLLPVTVDSYTRQNRYHEAQTGIEASRNAGRSMLNGFPVVNHGVLATRQVVEQVGRPIQVRHGTPDARLLAEISLAAGFTAFEGGGISYNIPYAKEMPLELTIAHWQYVDRLVGWYEERGIAIDREPFGPLTGTLVPPCISHAVAIIEALLAAEQGVRNITVGYGQCGNLVQDVAALRVLRRLVAEYLGRFHYDQVRTYTVFHQWMGGFPPDEAKAFAVIGLGAVAAAFSGATKVIVKSPHEAFGVPTKEANAEGLKTTRQVLNMLRDQSLPDSPELQEETEMVEEETRCILERVLELGDGDWAVGAVRAFAAGVLDVPFAPSRCNRGKVMPVRDQNGAVRLLDPGNLPLSKEIMAFHQRKIGERARAEERPVSFQMVIDDIYAISKGMLVGRPR